jgi:hypothetical protein
MARKTAIRRSKGGLRARALVPQERIGRRILFIRGQKVLVDADLAQLYGVPTEALNQAVKRNRERFPDDFMFRLEEEEKEQVITNCDHLGALKFSRVPPLVFTEQGVAMLSSVLRGPRAVAVNIEIMRAFVRLRQFIGSHEKLAHWLKKLEGRANEHGAHIEHLYGLLDELINPPEPAKKRRIGFYDPDVDGELPTDATKGSRKKLEVSLR